MDLLDLQDPTVLQENVAPLACQVLQEHQELGERKEHRGREEIRDRRAMRANREHQGCRGPQDLLDNAESEERADPRVQLDPQGLEDDRVTRGHQGMLVPLEYPASQGPRVAWERKDRPGRLAGLEREDPQDLLVLLGLMV